jgi:hypothetical protein
MAKTIFGEKNKQWTTECLFFSEFSWLHDILVLFTLFMKFIKSAYRRLIKYTQLQKSKKTGTLLKMCDIGNN